MTVVLLWPDSSDQRWAAWIAKGQDQDERMAFRMRLVFMVAAAGAVCAAAIL